MSSTPTIRSVPTSNSISTIVPAKQRTPDLDLLWSKSSADYKKTEEAYKQKGVRYERPPQQLEEERWYAKVTNPNVGGFIQPSQLKAASLVSQDYENSNVYPIKTVYQLMRTQTADGKEWLTSKQMWIGLDRLGNEIPQAMEDKETWWKPVFHYDQVKLNPNDTLSKIEKRTLVSDFTKEFTLPFSAKAADQIYALRKPQDKVSLVIRDWDPNNQPRGLEKYTDFRDREIGELWEWATTPKYSLDRSIKDMLNERQYG